MNIANKKPVGINVFQSLKDGMGELREFFVKNANSMTSIFLFVLGILATIYAANSIRNLGVVHFQTTGEIATLGAIVSVGLLVIMSLRLAFGGNAVNLAEKAILLVFIVIWLILVSLMTLAESALSVKSAPVSQDIVTLGQFLFSALPAISLIPILLTPVIAMHMPYEEYHSIFEAVGAIVGVIVKFVSVAAGIVAEAYFGLHYKIEPIYVVIASMVVGLGFIWALASLSRAASNKDLLDVVLYSSVIFVFGLYLILISAESVNTLAEWGKTSIIGSIVVNGKTFDEITKSMYQMALGVFITFYLIVFIVSHIFDVKLEDGKLAFYVLKTKIGKGSGGGGGNKWTFPKPDLQRPDLSKFKPNKGGGKQINLPPPVPQEISAEDNEENGFPIPPPFPTKK